MRVALTGREWMMRKWAVFSAAALIGVGALTSTASQAGDRSGAIAAGALIGAAASNADAAPAYGYPDDRYGYNGDGYRYRPADHHFDEGFQARPYAKRVVVRRFVEDDVEACRVIVKRRYNAFGDLVIKRIRICD